MAFPRLQDSKRTWLAYILYDSKQVRIVIFCYGHTDLCLTQNIMLVVGKQDAEML